MTFLAVSLWGAFMMGAIFYTQEARHPETKLLSAYMTFVAAFSAAAVVLFGGLMLLVQGLGLSDRLDHPLAAFGFQLAVFLPAFLFGRWQLRKPPRQAPRQAPHQAPLPDRAPRAGKQF